MDSYITPHPIHKSPRAHILFHPFANLAFAAYYLLFFIFIFHFSLFGGHLIFQKGQKGNISNLFFFYSLFLRSRSWMRRWVRICPIPSPSTRRKGLRKKGSAHPHGRRVSLRSRLLFHKVINARDSRREGINSDKWLHLFSVCSNLYFRFTGPRHPISHLIQPRIRRTTLYYPARRANQCPPRHSQPHPGHPYERLSPNRISHIFSPQLFINSFFVQTPTDGGGQCRR